MNFKLQREIRTYAGLVTLLLGLLAGCGGGGGTPPNAPPQPTITLSGAITGGADNPNLVTSTGNDIVLDASSSKDPDGDALAYRWTLESKPAGSVAQLTATTGASSHLVPDVLGDYVVKVVATDTAGASSSYQTTVSVKNQRPQAVIDTNATPIALASGPALRLPLRVSIRRHIRTSSIEISSRR